MLIVLLVVVAASFPLLLLPRVYELQCLLLLRKLNYYYYVTIYLVYLYIYTLLNLIRIFDTDFLFLKLVLKRFLSQTNLCSNKKKTYCHRIASFLLDMLHMLLKLYVVLVESRLLSTNAISMHLSFLFLSFSSFLCVINQWRRKFTTRQKRAKKGGKKSKKVEREEKKSRKKKGGGGKHKKEAEKVLYSKVYLLY